ncbi:hypothetical protein CKM354_000849200 [Cercospora kikuchii]|uniref:Peptidase M43 pregnancy-associated plasma-A domain-containing protein n=1 Tax=Cercospora kikuchii TaxID=84275 RepID=A0A9P3CM36_9PEZI|nr:uncharacterized protein CKM354_000849200 [Cercospora kikuchii]GIZ45319.1 hypothetical protein CKM354_000849200 [Cercospora kikuchii]
MKFNNSFLAAAAASIASAQSTYTRCGLGAPAAEQVAALEAAAAEGAANLDISRMAAATIPTYVHVVTSSSKQGRYSAAQIQSQISAMNQAYAGMGFTFTLASTDYTVNNNWAAANLGTTNERNMKTALRKAQGYDELDLYFLSDIPGGTLGWCYFPVSSPTASDRTLDGCVNLADSLPGGAAAPFNEGATATHEIGHWLGLFHVFQGQSCSGAGDSVNDTPPQRTATSGCPVGKDTCSGGGVDSIHNWMDYSDDACMDRFTAGQTQRATSLFNQLRSGR